MSEILENIPANLESLPAMQEAALLGQLRSVLLKDDRDALAALEDILNNRAKLSDKVNPIIEDHIEFLRKNFPKEYGKVVNRMIEQKLKDSQKEILDVIYPVMGKMINKYITFQFQQLKESIDARIQSLFSRRGVLWYFRTKVLGMNSGEMLLASMDVPLLEEIFVIQRDSGLILGTAALQPTVNREAIAGMLTAIKAFAEDAFSRQSEELEMVQYGTYRILLHNFPYYYFALALSGSVSAQEGEQYRHQIIDFIQACEVLHRAASDDIDTDIVSKDLDTTFITPERNKHLSRPKQII